MGETNYIALFFRVAIAFLLMTLGIYEAVFADLNHDNLSTDRYKAYIFTSIKASVNMFSAIIICCTPFVSTNQSKTNNTDSILTFINLGLLIWTMIMYTDMIKNDHMYNPYRTVIYMEFIIAIVWLSILALIMVLGCVCGVCFIISKISERNTVQPIESELSPTHLEHEQV